MIKYFIFVTGRAGAYSKVVGEEGIIVHPPNSTKLFLPPHVLVLELSLFVHCIAIGRALYILKKYMVSEPGRNGGRGLSCFFFKDRHNTVIQNSGKNSPPPPLTFFKIKIATKRKPLVYKMCWILILFCTNINHKYFLYFYKYARKRSLIPAIVNCL